MPRRPSGADHLDSANDYLDAMTKALKEEDWAKLSTLADAAQAHLSAASLAWEVLSAPGGLLSGRQGQRWREAAGVETPR